MVRDLPEGTVTVLFTDVEGSTELAASAGDRVARERLRECEELAREQVARRGGYEVKGTGDGLMVAFNSAHEAVACAIDIQRAIERRNVTHPDRAVRLRIGLNSGDVIRERDDLFGTTVNVAARIEAAADPGEILVSEGVRFLLGAGTDIELTARGEFELRGLGEPWRLFEVEWRESGVPATGAQTPLIGREAERAELRRLLQEGEQGRGALVMIGGEPGVGKTRLTSELSSDARDRGFLTFTGHCYDTEGTAPYIPFVEMLETAARTLDLDAFRAALGEEASQAAKLMPRLRQLFPDIPAALELPPEQERRFLLNSMRDYVARVAQNRPLLLVFEDLHWADEPTLGLFQHLVEGVSDAQLLIVGTYRDTDLDARRPLASALSGLLRHRSAVDLNLERLTREGVAAMLRAFGGAEPPGRLLDLMVRETEGNPFFVEQVLKHLSEAGRLLDEDGHWRTDVEIGEDEVPRGVRLVIGQRLERVSEECLRTLTSAAVIGRTFNYGLLRRLSDASDDELLDAMDEAEGAQLISSRAVAGEAQMMFAHEQIRQTLLGTLSLPRRQRLHLAVADAIEAGSEPDEQAADLAHHLFQAGAIADSGKTARYLGLAGAQAMRAAAFEEAVRLYENALMLQPSEDRAGRAELLFRLGLARRALGRWDLELDDWREAVSIYEQIGDVEAVGRLCYEMSLYLSWAARFEESAEIAFRGLAALGDSVSADRGRLLAAAGVPASYAPRSLVDHAAVEGMFSTALEIARQPGNDQLESSILRAKIIHDQGWLHCSAINDYGRQAAEQLRSGGDRYSAVDVLSFVVASLGLQGRMGEAAELAGSVREESAYLGHSAAGWLAGLVQAFANVGLMGNLADYEVEERETLDVAVRSGIPWAFMSHACVGAALFWQGRWGEAREQFEQRIGDEVVSQLMEGVVSGPLLRLAAYSGERAEALNMFRERRDHFPGPGEPVGLGGPSLIVGAIEGLAVLGERGDAAALYDSAITALDTGAVIPVDSAGLLEIAAAIAAACGERWEQAEQHFETALQQAHELPHRIAQPDVRRWYAWMLLDRGTEGDTERARELLAEAIEMYREIGMPKHLEIAEGMLAEA